MKTKREKDYFQVEKNKSSQYMVIFNMKKKNGLNFYFIYLLVGLCIIFFVFLNNLFRIYALIVVIYKAFAKMWLKAIWMGHPMRLKLTCIGLPV